MVDINPELSFSKLHYGRQSLSVAYIIKVALVYVNGIKRHFEHGKNGGAKIISQLEKGYPGTCYRAADLEGQLRMFIEKNKISYGKNIWASRMEVE